MKVLFGLFWNGAGCRLGGRIRKVIQFSKDNTAKLQEILRLDLLQKSFEIKLWKEGPLIRWVVLSIWSKMCKKGKQLQTLHLYQYSKSLHLGLWPLWLIFNTVLVSHAWIMYFPFFFYSNIITWKKIQVSSFTLTAMCLQNLSSFSFSHFKLSPLIWYSNILF